MVLRRMITVLGREAHMLVQEWGGDSVTKLSKDRHGVFAFNGAPVIVFRSSGLGPAVDGWTFILPEAVASDFWRKAALKVCFQSPCF